MAKTAAAKTDTLEDIARELKAAPTPSNPAPLPTPTPEPTQPAPAVATVSTIGTLSPTTTRYRLLERDMHRASEDVQWNVVVPPTVPYAAIIADTAFWANVARLMRVGNFIYVNAADNSYFAMLVVLDLGVNWAKVGELWRKEFEPQMTAGDRDIPGYELKWDRLQKHYFMRLSDRHVVASGFESRSQAYAALADHVLRLGR